MSLTNRVAIITGGSRGLGEAIADRFLRDGAKVSLCARDEDELRITADQLAQRHGADRVLARKCDISILTEVANLFEETIAAFGQVNILVNNAGMLGPVGPIDECLSAPWLKTIMVNIGGTAYCTQSAIAHMKQAGYGKIINIAGGGGADPLPRRSAYACSKAAIVRLTDTVADEVRSHGIDVNAIAPGPMATRMMDANVAAGPDRLGKQEYAAHVGYQQSGDAPLKRAAKLCAWLASSESDGLTGRYIAARHDPFPLTKWQIAEVMKSDRLTLRRVGLEKQAARAA